MNKIDEKMYQLKEKGRIGLMSHVVVGYPSLDATVRLVRLMGESGVDMVELQIPFSDPLADGPTIMRACEEALSSGVKVRDAFTLMHQLVREVSIPLLFMAYYNTVFRYGTKAFVRDAQRAGAAGVIVPDIPLDEEHEEHFMTACNQFDIPHIRVISPSATNERLKKNAKVAKGFVYCTARQGITGARETLDPTLATFLKRVRSFFAIPIAVGFGISKKEHLRSIEPYADIAVVGSAIIDIINRSSKKNMEREVASFLKALHMVH